MGYPVPSIRPMGRTQTEIYCAQVRREIDMLAKQESRTRISIICLGLFLAVVLVLAMVTPAGATVTSTSDQRTGELEISPSGLVPQKPLRIAMVVYVLDARAVWHKFQLAHWQFAKALWHTGIVL